MVATLERLEKAERRKRDADLVIGVLTKHHSGYAVDDRMLQIAEDMHNALEAARGFQP